ncbi:hypothetical protein QJS10_CPA09g00954 [Acorus calamus]|uniref:RNA polymerase II transcription factor B subunit 2 n=1 Tax=Acorus calamus TaxID=4465 RepID=A0AAV9E2D7_ACOCL|nr:hypothetical protein QJS10_CPA09g00954 [Acorus calamus]
MVCQRHLQAKSKVWTPLGNGKTNAQWSLPPLAKKYALQLLFIDSPISAKTMEGWVLADGISKHRVAIDRLMQLRVFLEEIDRAEKKVGLYQLNWQPIFR